MSDRWTGWKSFPDDYHGEYIQAPMGPGVYEVCRASTREQIAFGCTRNVAESLCDRAEAARASQVAVVPARPALRHRRAGVPDLADRDAGRRQDAVSLIRERHEAVMRKYSLRARPEVNAISWIQPRRRRRSTRAGVGRRIAAPGDDLVGPDQRQIGSIEIARLVAGDRHDRQRHVQRRRPRRGTARRRQALRRAGAG